MPHILRGDDSVIVTRGGEDHLSGQNHVSIQGFVIGRWATWSPRLSPEDRQPLTPDVHPDTQPGLILIVLRTATAPLSQEELAQVPGVNRCVLGRNLTRLCDTGRVEKTADSRYVLQAVSQ